MNYKIEKQLMRVEGKIERVSRDSLLMLAISILVVLV